MLHRSPELCRALRELSRKVTVYAVNEAVMARRYASIKEQLQVGDKRHGFLSSWLSFPTGIRSREPLDGDRCLVSWKPPIRGFSHIAPVSDKDEDWIRTFLCLYLAAPLSCGFRLYATVSGLASSRGVCLLPSQLLH